MRKTIKTSLLSHLTVNCNFEINLLINNFKSMNQIEIQYSLSASGYYTIFNITPGQFDKTITTKLL